jgi:D-sedoheptulose 7-phosphate isomerase
MSGPLDQSVRDAREALDRFIADERNLARLDAVARRMAGCLGAGGRILAIGNGGSMCDAMHFCEELTGRFRDDRRPLAAIACSDPTHLTCVANDYGFEHVFSRWVEAMGREGDVLVAISTSGRSANVVKAVEVARASKIRVVGLLGKDGGVLAELCDDAWIVPGATSDRIQEIHMIILHTLVEGIEGHLAGLG